MKNIFTLSFLSQVANLILVLGTSILIARMLGSFGRGEYVLFTSTSLLIVQAITLGIDSSANHFIASRKIAREKVVSTIGWFFICSGILLLLVTIFLYYFSDWEIVPQNNPSYFILLYFYSLLQLGNILFSSIFNGLKRFKQVLLVNFLLLFLTFAFLLITFLFIPDLESTLNILQGIMFINLAIFLINCLIYYRTVGKISLADWISREELKSMFNYSALSFLCSLLQFLSYRMDFWIINHYFGSAELGIYSLAATLSQLIWLIPQSVAVIMFPLTASLKSGDVVAVTNKISRISILLTISILPITIIFGFFIPKIFGAQFERTVSLFLVFLIGVVPFVIVKIIASVFAGVGKVTFNFWATAVGFLLAVGLYLIFIPKFGSIAGAVASTISYLATTVVGLFLYKRYFKTSLKDLLIFRSADIKLLFSIVKLKKT